MPGIPPWGYRRLTDWNLLGENNELKNRYTHVRWNKQDIQEAKQDIETQKQDIRIPETFSKKTKQHIQRLFSAFGYDKFFGRTELMNVLEITASPASELIKKMLESELIYPLKGKGKGKYLFRKQ